METLNKLLQINGNYITIGLITIFFISENLLQTEFKFNKTRKHLLENIGFEIIKFLPNLFWSVVVVKSIVWLNNHEIGLFYLITIPYWLKLVLSVFIFDLTNYWLHRTAHQVPLIWRFHRVHHSDSRMDASSSLRIHPIEVVFYLNSSTIIASALFGFDLFSVGLFYFILVPWIFFTHSNLKYPSWIDKTVGLIFMTPHFHRVHHDQDQFYTDSNYADIFILSDRLFGTFKDKQPDEIKLGLKEFEDDNKQSLGYLMILPFLKVRRTSSEELRDDTLESKS